MDLELGTKRVSFRKTLNRIVRTTGYLIYVFLLGVHGWNFWVLATRVMQQGIYPTLQTPESWLRLLVMAVSLPFAFLVAGLYFKVNEQKEVR